MEEIIKKIFSEMSDRDFCSCQEGDFCERYYDGVEDFIKRFNTLKAEAAKTVFGVSTGWGDDYRIKAIFSTKEKALNYIKKNGVYLELNKELVSFELDPEPEDVPDEVFMTASRWTDINYRIKSNDFVFSRETQEYVKELGITEDTIGNEDGLEYIYIKVKFTDNINEMMEKAFKKYLKMKKA